MPDELARGMTNDSGAVTLWGAWVIVAVLAGGFCALVAIAVGLTALTKAWGWWAAPLDFLAFVTFVAAGVAGAG